MHTRHRPGKICTWYPAAKSLSRAHLTGLVLDEFGHLGSGAGDVVADRWVFIHFGIMIKYEGDLLLEKVSPEEVGIVFKNR